MQELTQLYRLPVAVSIAITRKLDISALRPWQRDCLNVPEVALGGSMICSTPTSGGKTLVALIFLLRSALVWRSRNIRNSIVCWC